MVEGSMQRQKRGQTPFFCGLLFGSGAEEEGTYFSVAEEAA